VGPEVPHAGEALPFVFEIAPERVYFVVVLKLKFCYKASSFFLLGGSHFGSAGSLLKGPVFFI
jgi:hypothetical protein